MKPWEIIQQLEATSSRLEKEKILEDNWPNREFKEGLKLALDPLITFGIKQIPEKVGGEPWPTIKEHVNRNDQHWISGDTLLTYHDFKYSSDLLSSRQCTGNNAKAEIEGMIGRCETNDEWNYWYRRILLKDLKCGISEKTVNKMYGKGFIPIFGCMLAKDGSEIWDTLKQECIVEYKLDGVRCIAMIENSECILYTRSGRVIENFPHINKALGKEYYNGYVLDGELMGSDFQLLMKKLNAHRDSHLKKKEDFKEYLAVFDILTIEEFKAGKCDKPQLERKKQLDNLFRGDVDLFWNPAVHSVNYDVLDLSKAHDNDRMMEINAAGLQQKFEGIMVKPSDRPYVVKRSDAWLKIKPYIEVTLEIKDIEEGTGKNIGKLGALICEGSDSGKFIKVSVGSGLSDDDRDSIWDNSKDYIGRLVEIRADAITKAEDSDHWSLRFPRFKGVRGFEPGEKI